MKKLFLAVAILYLVSGVYGQSRAMIYKTLITHEIINGQATGNSIIEERRLPCSINDKVILLYNFSGEGSIHEFMIESFERNSNGIEVYKCLKDKIEYDLLFSPNDFSLIITSKTESYNLYMGKVGAVDEEVKLIRKKKKNGVGNRQKK